VASLTEELNSEWRIAEETTVKLSVGGKGIKLKAYILQRKRQRIEALPYPIKYENQFIQWHYATERRKHRKDLGDLHKVIRRLQSAEEKARQLIQQKTTGENE